MSNKDIVGCLWAKANVSSPEQSLCHPLLFHMLDSAAVCEQLLLRTAGDPTVSLISTALDLSASETVLWLPWYVGLHDMGKCSQSFQMLAPELYGRFPADFRSGKPDAERFQHNELTDPVLEPLNLMVPILRQILACHHGRIIDAHRLDHAAHKINRQPSVWTDLVRTLYSSYEAALCPNYTLPSLPPCRISNASGTLLMGLVCFCDWIASNTTFFPYTDAAMAHDEYLASAKMKAERALETLRIGRWQPELTPRSFEQLFPGKSPRPTQKRAAELVESSNPPRLVILELPMGSGKTEAALNLQNHWAASLHQRGAYFALPTMASSNQMYGRVRTTLEQSCDAANLHLLHGRAPFVEDYASSIIMQSDRCDVDEMDASGVAAVEWFTRPKRGLLGDFAVGTVDQVFLSVLQARHFFLRLYGLSGKTVIFDEVHAYDAYMNGLFSALLEWMKALDSTVAVLSATLPKSRLREMTAAWAAHDFQPAEYPRITWVDSSGHTHSEHIPTPPESPVILEWWETHQTETLNRLGVLLANGGHVAWICNTVGSAQRTFLRLKCQYGDRVSLFHARFPYAKRAEAEQSVFHAFGKERPSDGLRILVATQVVEQSLDLDFDLMITELAPIDLLLQRAGRLHRHSRSRPSSLNDRRLVIITPPDGESGLPELGASRYVYAPDILLRTLAFLSGRTKIEVPGDVETLIEEVYGEAPLPEDVSGDYKNAVIEYTAKRAQEERNLAGAAAICAIFKPDARAGDGWDTRDLEEDESGRVSDALRAKTRIGQPSREVVFTREEEDGLRIFDGVANPVVPANSAPTGENLRRVLEATVRLSWHGGMRELPNVLPDAWKKSTILRHLHCLSLDGDLELKTESRTIRLDPLLGVVLETQTRSEDSHESSNIQSDH